MTKNNLLDIGVKVLLAAGIGILFLLHFQAQQSLVYVDAQKLVVGYEGMKAARLEFESKSAAWKANLDTLRNEVEEKMKEYDSKKASMNAREKQLSEELIKSKQEQYINYEQVIQEKVQTEDQQLTKNVLTKVNDFVKRYGKEHGYKIILAATQYGNIVYAQDGIDVTDDVLKGLNTEFPNP
jgi:outer membrane protein